MFENTKSPFPHSGASRRRILDSYENTDFFLGGAKILVFRCKNTEIVK